MSHSRGLERVSVSTRRCFLLLRSTNFGERIIRSRAKRQKRAVIPLPSRDICFHVLLPSPTVSSANRTMIPVDTGTDQRRRETRVTLYERARWKNKARVCWETADRAFTGFFVAYSLARQACTSACARRAGCTDRKKRTTRKSEMPRMRRRRVAMTLGRVLTRTSSSLFPDNSSGNFFLRPADSLPGDEPSAMILHGSFMAVDRSRGRLAVARTQRSRSNREKRNFDTVSLFGRSYRQTKSN